MNKSIIESNIKHEVKDYKVFSKILRFKNNLRIFVKNQKLEKKIAGLREKYLHNFEAKSGVRF